MYTLYYSPGACSMAVHVLLNELKQEVELKRVNLHGPEKDAALLQVNPRHQVPVLVDDDHIIREGAAILMHLADKHKSALMPQSGPARDLAIEWLCFGNATMHPAYSLGFSVRRVSDDSGVQDAVAAFAVKKIQTLWDDVETRLGQSKYLAGDQVTVGDILLTVIANWTGKMPKPVNIGPNAKRLLKDISNRPAYQAALQAEEVEYKAAA